MFPLAEKMLIALKGDDNVLVKLLPNHYQYKPGTYRVFTKQGARFKVDLSDWMGYAAYFNMKIEWYDTLFSLVKPGMVILDIGANIGFTALNMAKLAKDKGIVYAFEPDEYNHKALLHNLQMNAGLNVKPVKLGLGNTTAQLKLSINEGNRGINKITESVTEGKYGVVNIVKLDDFVTDTRINKIDLIKIDTEGYEVNILKGAEKTLLKFKPVLFIEIDEEHLVEQHSSAKDTIAYIKSLGYEITSDKTGKVVDVNDDFINCHFDVICRAVVA
jgi:FkbM family methyltransferase